MLALRIFFSDLFRRFSNRFSDRFNFFSGVVSFCRRAALTLGVMDVRAKKRGRPHQKNGFSCGPGDGENLFEAWAPGHKGKECPHQIRTKKFMFMLFFLP